MTAAPSTPLDLDGLEARKRARRILNDPAAEDFLPEAFLDAARENAALHAELEAMKAEADDQAQTIERLSIACGEQTIEIASLRDQLNDMTLAAATARERTLIGLVETAREALDEDYRVSALAFQRIHGLPRTTDTEIADKIARARVQNRQAQRAIIDARILAFRSADKTGDGTI